VAAVFWEKAPKKTLDTTAPHGRRHVCLAGDIEQSSKPRRRQVFHSGDGGDQNRDKTRTGTQ